MDQNQLLVVKSNKLIEAQGSLTLLEQKLFLSTIATIDRKDADFKEYNIEIKKFGNLLGMKTKALYSELDKATDKLASSLIKIEKLTESNKVSRFKTTLFSSVEYIEGEGFIKVLIDPKLKPYLLELSGNFTSYDLENILKFKSNYSVRIYELLKQRQDFMHRVFEVDELKILLGFEKEYPRFYDFEKRVLLVAKKEINEHTDLHIDYEKKKEGRKITEIKFVITKVVKIKELKKEDYNTLYDDDDPIIIKTRKIVEGLTLNKYQIDEIYSIACDKADSGTERIHNLMRTDGKSEEEIKNTHLDPYDYIRLNYAYLKTKKGINKKIPYFKKILEEDGAKVVFKMIMEKIKV